MPDNVGNVAVVDVGVAASCLLLGHSSAIAAIAELEGTWWLGGGGESGEGGEG